MAFRRKLGILCINDINLINAVHGKQLNNSDVNGVFMKFK